VWRVNDARITYAPAVDDTVWQTFSKRRARSFEMLIVPPGCGELIREALRSRNPDAPEVRPLDYFMDFRVIMTALDTAWSFPRTT
jgi:hypothetical protein